MRALVLVLPVLLLAPLAAQDHPLPDLVGFADQVKAHLVSDEERQNDYMFIERRTAQKVDGAGRSRTESVDVFEVYPGLPGEGRYRRLIEEHGKPVPPETLARRDRDRRKAVESYARKVSMDAERQKEARQREKDRERQRAVVDDLFRIYDIRLVRREALEGHETIVATLTPKDRAKPRTDEAKFLRHFKARVWVSESEYEPVRVELEAIDDLGVGWGLLARVHKGTVATYQRRKVNNEVWLPERATWTASARVLLLKRLRLRGVAEFSGYRKFIVDTSTTPASLQP